MFNKPFRILNCTKANETYPYYWLEAKQYESEEEALKDAKEKYPNEECVIINLYHYAYPYAS